MVCARLHIVCGNCGCNKMFNFSIEPKGHDVSDGDAKFEPAVYIRCRNCSTLHDLSTTIPQKKEDNKT